MPRALKTLYALRLIFWVQNKRKHLACVEKEIAELTGKKPHHLEAV